MSAILDLTCEFFLEVAHHMPHFPEGHPNTRLHGHSYQGLVTLRGPLDPVSGTVMDIERVREKIKGMVEELDHHYLNEIPGLESPSSERLAVWIWNRLKPSIPQLIKVELKRPSIGMSVSYEGPL